MRFDTTPGHLLETASGRTGLSDFGDERFRAPFTKMIEAINAESDFTEEGRALARERFLRLLINRLRFREDVRRHPEILAEEIAPPLIILGLPRTGSTKLQRMMGEAGDFRSMLLWQGLNPAPFPDAVAGSPDPRIVAAAEFLAWRSSRHASISRAHSAQAQEPEEEVYLLEHSFTNWSVAGYYEMPSYIEWLRGYDRDHVYRLVRELLQYLQWQHHRGAPPKPWLLKTPPNLGHEAAIQANLPGARFVMLHRDVREAIPSLVSMTYGMRHQYLAGEPSRPAIATWLLAEARDILDRHMAWRDANPDVPVIDIAYRDVLDDDMRVVERIYDFLGIELNEASRAAMLAWSRDNGQHRHGEHVYTLEDTGLTEGDIERALAPYITRFGAYL